MRLSTTDPTEVAVSLVFVVQSPWAGFTVPNATVAEGSAPEDDEEDDEAVDDEDDEDVDLWLLAHADPKTKATASTSGATVADRRDDEERMRAILFGRVDAEQGLSSPSAALAER